MRRTFAWDSVIAVLAALFFAQFGIRLIFVYLAGSVINIQLAILMLIIGLAAIPIIAVRPICLKLEDGHWLTIYSGLGLIRAKYDLLQDVVSIVWVGHGGVIQMSLKNGNNYHFSRQSFFGLKQFFEGF